MRTVPRRLLLTGASGQLGAYLLRELAGQSLSITAWSGANAGELFGFPLRAVDLANQAGLVESFRAVRPDLVVHAAALASVADCCRSPDRARQVNVDGTRLLAELAAGSHARLVCVSTDLVFDGVKGHYREEDAPAPLSVYGRTKLEAEQAVLAFPGNAVARLSLLFGPSLNRRPAFFDQQVSALDERRPLALFEDEWRTPLSLKTAAQALLALARSDFPGRLHLGGPERMSRLEMGQRLAAFLGLDRAPFLAARRAEMPAAEPRPRDTSLDCSRWRRLFPEPAWPPFEEALRELF